MRPSSARSRRSCATGRLGRIVWVADRGFASAENRRALRRGDEHYILAEKLRSGSAEAKAALARAGRYRELAGGLRVKEVRIGRRRALRGLPPPRDRGA